MQLKETLDELLYMFGAHVIKYDSSEFTVTTSKALPIDLNKIATSYNIEVPYTPVITSNGTIMRDAQERATYTYVFPAESKEAIRTLLFLASEKQRYEAFCESIDNEVTEELGTIEE